MEETGVLSLLTQGMCGSSARSRKDCCNLHAMFVISSNYHILPCGVRNREGETGSDWCVSGPVVMKIHFVSHLQLPTSSILVIMDEVCGHLLEHGLSLLLSFMYFLLLIFLTNTVSMAGGDVSMESLLFACPLSCQPSAYDTL